VGRCDRSHKVCCRHDLADRGHIHHSLSRFRSDERTAIKVTAFEFQMNPSATDFSFHKWDRAKGKRFCSIRVNADVGPIVHRTNDTLLLCFVDHEDRAHAGAEWRKVEMHGGIGAAQTIDLRESVREIVLPRSGRVCTQPGMVRPLARCSDDRLPELIKRTCEA
jgi:hypothetical protein